MPPRRSLPVIAAVAPITELIAPPPPSPLIQHLRTDWRWAGISQFIWTFSDAFGLLDWDIEALETDLDNDETNMMPDLLAKMLYALTYNRQINRDNAFDHLRKQYAKRAPDQLLFGTEEEPRTWAALGLGEKVQVLWDLCEWQMADPGRFRALLKSEEDAFQWRIEPFGWDKEGNTYYLFDDNRLWIQRPRPVPPTTKKSSQKARRAQNKRPRADMDDFSPSPPPPTPKSKTKAKSKSTPKAKATPKVKSGKKRAASPDLTPPPPVSPPAEDTSVSGRRKRTQVAFFGNPISVVEALRRGGPRVPASATPSGSKITRSSSRGGLNVVSTPGPTESTPSRSSAPAAPTPSSLSRGTRATRRTRQVEEEWQPIPDEWLQPEGEAPQPVGAEKEDGDGQVTNAVVESELSSLTDEVEGDQLDSNKTRIGEEEEKVEEDEGDLEEGGDEDVKMDDAEEKAQPEDTEMGVDATEMQKDNGDVEMKEEGLEEKPVDEPKVEVEPEETDEVKLAVKEVANVPEGFVEWEAVCVTLYDWRTFPEKFRKSKDQDEKNLYSLLTEAAGPTIIAALVAKEQERLKQEAVNNRKRSSRIATKELEKEEILRRQTAQREMEDRMEKSRRDENSKDRSEATVVAQERAREDRLKEREDRIAAREIAIAQKAEEEQNAKDKADRARIRRQRRREGETVETSDESEGEGSTRPTTAKASRNGTPVAVASKSQKANGKRKANEGWELKCEICKRSGWNMDDDVEDKVSCDDCGRWQHTGCHDRQDASEGRPRRNWDQVDFKCQECRRKTARKRQRVSNEPRSSPLAQAPPIHAHQQYHTQASPYANGHPNGIRPPVSFYPSANGHPSLPPSQQPRPVYAHVPGGEQVYGSLTRQMPVMPSIAGQGQRPPQGYPMQYAAPQQQHPGQRPAHPQAGYPHPQQMPYPPQGYRPPIQMVNGANPYQQQHPNGPPVHVYPGQPNQAPRPGYQYTAFAPSPVPRNLPRPSPQMAPSNPHTQNNGPPNLPRPVGSYPSNGPGGSYPSRPSSQSAIPAQMIPRPQQIGPNQYAQSPQSGQARPPNGGSPLPSSMGLPPGLKSLVHPSLPSPPMSRPQEPSAQAVRPPVENGNTPLPSQPAAVAQTPEIPSVQAGQTGV